MGTNFYLSEDVCGHCGRGDEPLHIGKSSAGWVFALHVIRDEGLNSLEDWQRRWEKGVIKDEYGFVMTPEEMHDKITKRSSPRIPDIGNPNLSGALLGPNNLCRRPIGRYCIGHGKGTWDLIASEFS